MLKTCHSHPILYKLVIGDIGCKELSASNFKMKSPLNSCNTDTTNNCFTSSSVTLHGFIFVSYNQYFSHGTLQNIVPNGNLPKVWISVYPRSKKKLKNPTHARTHARTHTHRLMLQIIYAISKKQENMEQNYLWNKLC